jgi:hypothetical protein
VEDMEVIIIIQVQEILVEVLEVQAEVVLDTIVNLEMEELVTLQAHLQVKVIMEVLV